MTLDFLTSQIREKQSYLCVGLDTDIRRIPKHLMQYDDPVFEFNKRIIEQTHDLCAAYKLNIAFYESMGAAGWHSLEKTMEIIPKEIFTIADAKRGDIGNTSSMYARTFFETYDFDSITVNPYMGSDSVKPFLGYKDKWVILLGLTSNKGSQDFQQIEDQHGKKLYENVIDISKEWGSAQNMMFVVGATHPEQLAEIRKMVPDHYFLIPGVGAQGGDLMATSLAGWNDEVGMLVNSSRGIIYASNGEDFAEVARTKAMELQDGMHSIFRMKEIPS